MEKQVKKRRITKKDWDSVADFVKKEHEKRKKDRFRVQHEQIWREVDRMVAMLPMKRFSKNGQEVDVEWRSVVELGELAKTSEIITADVMRLTFPSSRSWFEAHSELPTQIDPNTGEKKIDQKAQDYNDRALRAFMVQQHFDFGLKARYELSVKEALHHGSYVSEIRFEKRVKILDNGKAVIIGAPVWQPYSMWNAFPDPSPSVIGTDLFYTGSMILVDYIPMYQLRDMIDSSLDQGWMKENIKKIPKRENKNKDVTTEDVELIKFYGDIEIKRDDGNIILPNSRVIVANDVIMYWSPNDIPYPPIIYSGYERMDVRDPYYTSPLIKLVPMQKLGSQLANKYADGVWLRVEPPINYDGNDPAYVQSGGPQIHPGAKNPVKGEASWAELKVGEPEQALQGLQFIIQQLQEGTGVNAIRAGAAGDSSDKTATEIRQSAAKAEIRTVEFVDKQERHSLRPFLYMQHELNKLYLEDYSFYNPEMDAPDFMWATRDQLPINVQFEVVGSRGILGEEERTNKTSAVTAFLLGNPKTAHLPNVVEISKQMYQDAGNKNPENLLNLPTDERQSIAQEIDAQYQDAMQQMQGAIQELQQQLAVSKAVNEAKIQEATIRADINAQTIAMSKQFELFKQALDERMAIIEHNLKVSESGGKTSPVEIKMDGKGLNVTMPDNDKEVVREVTKAVSSMSDKLESALSKLNAPKKRKVKAPSGREYTLEEQ